MRLNKPNVRATSIFLFVFSLILGHHYLSYAGTVVIRPGQFDHFTVQVPDRLIAGENFIIKVQAYDSNNNLIVNFQEYGKEFRVDINDSAIIQPSILNAASFAGGTANVSVYSRKAEKITFSIREAGGTVPVISKELTVLPNKLDHFDLQTQGTAVAGSTFDIRIVAKDFLNNTVNDLDIGRDFKITSTGAISLKVLGNSNPDFKNGIATITVVSEKTGGVVLELQETSTGSKGKTQNVTVVPSALSYFKVQAPKSAIAGEAFELLVTAYDPHGNIITNYSSVGNGVTLSATGSSKIEPSFIGPADFKNGQGAIKAFYEKAEEIQIIARESNTGQTGQSGEVLVSNTVPDHFIVITPDTGVSGQKFKVKVEAYDRFNNLVKNFNLVGNNVVLSTSGSGVLSPSAIPPSDFSNGVALLEVSYDKAESFLISAAMSADKSPSKITLKDQETRKEAPARKIPDKPAVQEEKVKEPAKKEVKAKAKTETERAAAERSAKVETKVQPSAVNDVTLIEAKNKEKLVISISSPGAGDKLVCSDGIESRYGREWLKIRVTPAVNKAKKSYKFKSAFVGDVQIEEDKDVKNTLDIYVELTSPGVSYDVARVKNTLVVTLLKR